MQTANVPRMPLSKKLSVALVGVAAGALVSFHAEQASACSIACISKPQIADQKLMSPVLKMPTISRWGHINPNAPAPTLRRGDVDVPITSINDGDFGLAIAAAQPLEPGEYTLVTSNGCNSKEETSTFTVLPGEPIPTEAAEITSTSSFEAADPNASMDSCGTRHGETFDHVNVALELRMPAALTPRFPLVRTTVSIQGPNLSTKEFLTPQGATLKLRELVVSCAGPSDKPQPGAYRVKVESELLGVGKLAGTETEIQISCPQTVFKPNKDPKPADDWVGEGPSDDVGPQGGIAANNYDNGSGSCSSSGGRPQSGAFAMLLGALGFGLVVRRRRRG